MPMHPPYTVEANIQHGTNNPPHYSEATWDEEHMYSSNTETQIAIVLGHQGQTMKEYDGAILVKLEGTIGHNAMEHRGG